MANAFGKAICFGVIAGMRSMSAPALVSNHYSKERSTNLDDSRLSFIASPAAAITLKVMALGELAADKSSLIPNRIDPGPLAFRAMSGAVCGAAIATADGEDSKIGGLAGGLAAVTSAFACYYLRREIGNHSKIPDIVLGLTEDALAIGVGAVILRSESSR